MSASLEGACIYTKQGFCLQVSSKDQLHPGMQRLGREKGVDTFTAMSLEILEVTYYSVGRAIKWLYHYRNLPLNLEGSHNYMHRTPTKA